MAKVLTEEQWQVHRNRQRSKEIEEILKSQDEHKTVSPDVRKGREKLPIYEMRQEIIRQIEENQIIIIEG
jgi:HrpA-like RNA helicase